MPENQNDVVVVEYRDKAKGYYGTYIGDKGVSFALFELADAGKEPRKVMTWDSFCEDYQLRQEVIYSRE